MAAPDRPRTVSFHALLPVLILLCLSSTASAASAVLGIDLGTEYIKAALVKPGIPLEIVLTKDSKRKEAATVAFKPSRLQGTDVETLPERLYGGDAMALAARFPGDVYPNLKVLLGTSVDSSAAMEYGSRYPGLNMESIVRNETSKIATIGFKSQAFDKEEPPFLVEELLAMELKNIKRNAEAAAGKGTEITDAVLTIPAFYTAEERRALELAADLAGLKALGLVSDGLAVGLNYATSRTFPSITEGATPEFHLVYDMGAGSTTATVLKFQGRTVKNVGKRNRTIQEVQVMSTSSSKGLGGDIWNQLILDDMMAKFIDTPRMQKLDVMPVHVRKNGKTMARLWKEAERMRQVLSANSQTSATFEGLFFEDVNFKYKLSRAEFEELAVLHASEVGVPLVHALDAANISIEALNSVILHGGAVRTPFVQKHLESVVGGSSKIRTNVNADEAAVLGAAFKAAGLSPSFRVKDIRAHDTPGYDVGLKWTNEGRQWTQKLFTQKSLIGAEKQVPFRVLEDFKFELRHIVDEEDIPILEAGTLNLTASAAQLKDKHGCVPANISTKFTMRLSPLNGLPEVVSGSVSCEVEAAKDGGVIDNVKGLFGFGSRKSEDQEPLKEDNDSEIGTTPTNQSTSAVSQTIPSASTSSTDKPAKPSTTTFTIPLSVTTRPLGLNLPLTPDQSARIRTRLRNLDSSDHARVRRAEALNALESFTYRARDYLTDPGFIAHSTQPVRDTLEQKLSEVSEWLYGDGIDAESSDFQDRLKGLKSLVDPILRRQDEASKREAAIQGLNEGLEQMQGMIKMVESSFEKAAEDAKMNAEAEAEKEMVASVSPPRTESAAATETVGYDETDGPDELDDDPYSTSSSPSNTASAASDSSSPPIISPYTPTDLSTLQSSYDSALKWLEEKLAAQGKLGPHDDPAVLVAEIEEKAREVQGVVRDVVAKNIRLPGNKKGARSGNGSVKTKAKKTKTKAQKGKPSSTTSESSVSGSVAAGDEEEERTATSITTTGSSTTTATSTTTSSSRKDEL
jgi:hypoxia up-regulated 1